MKRIKKIIFVIILFLGVFVYKLLPGKKYSNEDFNIDTFIGYHDLDNDGLFDNEDILENAKAYIKTRPKYKSAYYSTGYPNDGYGVCTDVVAFALKDAGYDLMELVYEDREEHPENYADEPIDKNIDFRRVRNLIVYFENNTESLTTDIYDIDTWQGGDIVIFKNHIGIVSDSRNKNGVPYVIHHANPFQIFYEEDILESRSDIVGHFRMN